MHVALGYIGVVNPEEDLQGRNVLTLVYNPFEFAAQLLNWFPCFRCVNAIAHSQHNSQGKGTADGSWSLGKHGARGIAW